ncbi:MAG TPA: rod shape-determining protein MreC [Saprospiraceae bacterium]|jgi:rod shape-determining protein MreC|nr:rod shape-determining protein MreC [Saprospiraceae bacterium]
MLKLLQQVIQHGSFILFLLLQFLCFYFIINYNQDQKKIYLYSHQKLNSFVTSRYKGVVDYFGLKKKNAILAEENARLMEQHYNSKTIISKENIETDSSFNALVEKYQIIPARVINNSINRPNNLITINKGGKDGILPNMGVITTTGIVGIVTDTSRNFSLVLSVLNPNCKISSKLIRCGFFGPMIWDGENPQYSTLVDIQKYADVKIGDTVSTSGYSYIFPGQVPIGTVNEIENNPGAFTYNIHVKLFQDMAILDEVYIIKNSTMMERSELESKGIKYE